MEYKPDIRVLQIQKSLNKMKIYYDNNLSAEDGIMNEYTEKLILRLFSILGMEDSNIDYNNILKIINPLNSKPELKIGTVNAMAIRYVQWRLNLNITGIYDIVTQSSVMKFQIRNGLAPKGVVDIDTWKKLISK